MITSSCTLYYMILGMVQSVYISGAFPHNGGQACVLQGSSSGTGLAAESHFLSGTSSSVWRSTQMMTLNWEPTGGQRNEMNAWQLVLARTNRQGEAFHSRRAPF